MIPAENRPDTEWRTSAFYGGDVAWFNGVLYRINRITARKFEVAYGGHFYRQWKDVGMALSRAEAESMCELHAIAHQALQDMHRADTED